MTKAKVAQCGTAALLRAGADRHREAVMAVIDPTLPKPSWKPSAWLRV
jgi:hypothetical protein